MLAGIVIRLPGLPRGLRPSLASAASRNLSSAPRWCPVRAASTRSGDTEHAAVQAATSGDYTPPEEHKRIGELQRQMRDMYREGRYGEARAAGTKCHALVVECFGTDHPATASVANNLALMHKSLGEMDDAQRLYWASLTAYRASLGNEHRSTATAACNLAIFYRDQGNAELRTEAIELLEEALEVRRRLLGEEHQDVAATMQQLASVLASEQADVPRAAELLAGAVSMLDDGRAGASLDAERGSRLASERDRRLQTDGRGAMAPTGFPPAPKATPTLPSRPSPSPLLSPPFSP